MQRRNHHEKTMNSNIPSMHAHSFSLILSSSWQGWVKMEPWRRSLIKHYKFVLDLKRWWWRRWWWWLVIIQNGDGQLLEWLDPVKGSASFLRDSQAKLLACVILILCYNYVLSPHLVYWLFFHIKLWETEIWCWGHKARRYGGGGNGSGPRRSACGFVIVFKLILE